MHGIYSSVPDVRIVNNVVFRVIGWDIHLWHAATANTVMNNTVYDTGRGGIVVGHGAGADARGNTGTYVANNIISRTRGVGIAEYNSAGATVSDNTYASNLVWSSPVAFSIGPSSTGTGTLEADPMFTATAGDDFRVDADSPAIDRGATANAPSTDVDGLPRRNSGGLDIGADER